MKNFKFSKLISLILTLAVTMNLLITVPVHAAEPTSADYTALRLKWFDYLTGGTGYDTENALIASRIADITSRAENVRSSLVKDSSAYLWADLNSWTVSSNVSSCFARIEYMALAYKTYGSSLYMDQALFADICYALEWMKSKYSTETSRFDNWYDWEIAAPKVLVNILVLLYDDINSNDYDFLLFYENAMERYNWSPTSYNMNDDTRKGTSATGANRAWIILIHTLRGVLTQNNDRITAAKDAVSALLVYSDPSNVGKVTYGDGFFEDGSFIQHTYFAYAGGYGRALMGELVKIIYLLSGSYWEITDANINNIYSFVKNSFEPFLYKGSTMDMICAREVSRYSRTSHSITRNFLYSIGLLAYSTSDPEKRSELIGLIKYHKETDTTITDFYETASIFEAEIISSMLNESSSYTPFSGYKQFPAMDRAVYTRPDQSYSVGLAMHSYSRTRNFEIVNNENRKGYNYSAGAIYLYNGDLTHYDDDYYPTTNYYRVPGTTVLQSKGLTHSTRSSDFAGGADMDGEYGTSAMIYTPRNSSNELLGLEARKSYFMFDDEIVLLGSAASTAAESVETIVENRKLKKDASNNITVNGESVLTSVSSLETKFENVNYAHLEGNTENSDIGYYFPGGANVYGAKKTETGTWKNLNYKYYTEDEKTNNYFTLRLAHGTAPSWDSYAVAILPNKTDAETKTYNDNPDIEIVKNTNTAQAVKEKNLGITGYAFYEDSYNVAGAVGSDKKAVVMLKEAGDNISISVSDPTWQNSGNITLTINAPYIKTISADSSVTAAADGDKTILTINTANKYGAAQKAVLQLGTLSNLPEPNPENPDDGGDITPADDFYEEYTAVSNTKRIESDFEALSVGANFGNVKSKYGWNQYCTGSATSEQTIFSDPHDSENNISQLRYSGTSYKTGATDKPFITKLRFMTANTDGTIDGLTGNETASKNNFYLRLRMNSSSLLYAVKLQGGDRKIGLGTNGTISGDVAYWKAGQWVNMIIGVTPKTDENGSYILDGSGKQIAIIKCFLSGAVTDADGNPFENGYTVLEKEVSVANGVFSDSTSRQYQFYTEGAQTDTLRYYIDDMNYYLPGTLTSSTDKISDAGVLEPVSVTFLNEIDITTAKAQNVKFVSIDGSEIAAASVSVDPSNLKNAVITPSSALKGNTEYKIKFETENGAVTDFANNIAKSVYFTTGAGEIEKIESINISASGNLNQATNNLSSVTFTADTTPDKTNIDASSVKWYVNNTFANQTGLTFEYTPESAGEYVIYAKTDDNIISNSLTLSVEQSALSPITAIEISSQGSLDQISDSMSKVIFNAVLTPDKNVDQSSVTWYVNDTLTDSNGTYFEFTPEASGTYRIKAVCTDVISNIITINVTDPILTESIKVTPAQITVWKDFTPALTPKATVYPETATYKDITWQSSEPEIASIDPSSGTITIKSEGSVKITAVSSDGSGAVSNEMILNITSPKQTADNQKLNIDSVGSKDKRIDINKYISKPENVGEGQIALWHKDAKGAFTITVDDSLEYDFDKWLAWKEKYGFPATFFVYTKDTTDFDAWQNLIDNGMDVQSHTQSHLDNDDVNALSTAEHVYEYQKPIELLSALNGRSNANVLAYSYGAGNEAVERQFYIAARGTSGKLNKAENVNYNWVGSQSMKGSLNILYTEDRQTGTKTTLEGAIKSLYDSTGYYKSYGVSYYGGWMCIHSHGLNTGKLANTDLRAEYAKNHPDAATDELDALKFGTGDVLEYVFENFLKPASDSGDIWVDTFANVAKYGQERDTASLNIISSDANEIKFTLTDEMDDTIFNYPLTVKFKVDSSWNNISAEGAEFKVVEEDGSKYVFVEAVPDRGIITISNSVSKDESELAVSAIGGTVTNSGTVDNGNWGSSKTETYRVDTQFTLTANADEESVFLYWKDASSNRIISNNKTITFTLGSGKKYTAVFVSDSNYYISFKNANGQITAEGYENSGIAVPENPYMGGYTFDGWYLNGVKQEFSAGDIISGITSNTTFNAGYLKNTQKYIISINSVSETISNEYTYNDKVICSAQDSDSLGNTFAYWTKNGEIVSYNKQYSFFATEDAEVTAIYSNETAKSKAIINVYATAASDGRIAFFAERNIPYEYTLIESGILLGTKAEMTLDDLSSYMHKAVSLSTNNNGQFTIRKKNVSSSETYFGRSYVIYSDGTSLHTLYSAAASYTMQ